MTNPTIYRQLTEDEFEQRFPLVENHLNADRGWFSHGDKGCLFETYDEEADFVRQQDKRFVWTLIDNNDGEPPFLSSGYHWVNRLGYLISTVPVPEGEHIEVFLD